MVGVVTRRGAGAGALPCLRLVQKLTAGIVPMVGDIADATLNYTLVVRPARKLDLTNAVTSQMLFNNAISAGVG